MKKFLALLTAIFLAVTITGCEKDTDSQQNQQQQQQNITLSLNNYKNYLNIEHNYTKTESGYILGMPNQKGNLNYSVYATQPGAFSNVSVKLKLTVNEPWVFHDQDGTELADGSEYILVNIKLSANGTYNSSTRIGAISGYNPTVTCKVESISGEFIPQ